MNELRPTDAAPWPRRDGPHSTSIGSSPGKRALRTGVPAAVRRLQTQDPDVIATALVGGVLEYLPLPGRPFASTLRVLRVADLLIQ